MAFATVHAIAAFVERVEARIGIPGFVVVDAVDALAQLAGGGLHVVAKAIVGRVRQHREYRAGLLIGGQRAVSEFAGNGSRRQFRKGHRPDQASRIAPWA